MQCQQNGDCIVTIDSVTSLSLYIFLEVTDVIVVQLTFAAIRPHPKRHIDRYALAVGGR